MYVSITVNECNSLLEMTMTSGQFSCNNGKYVSQDLVCDGMNDCDDGSDESRCGTG